MTDPLVPVIDALKQYEATASPQELAVLDQIHASVRDLWNRQGWELCDANARAAILQIAERPLYSETDRRIAAVLARHVV